MGDAVVTAAAVTEGYYDSSDADEFYFRVWGGEDIHIGVYNEDHEPIATVSRRTVDRMASFIGCLGARSRVLDLGAGYGGPARQLVQRFGCQVTCWNLSETQNARNRAANERARLDDLIRVVHGSFENVTEPDGSYDIVWSQDALLHSADRKRVLCEARRLLEPGGELIFTDPMQSDTCPPGVLSPILARIHLRDLGSLRFYRNELLALGFEERNVVDLTPHLVRHYERIQQELRTHFDSLLSSVTREYLEQMITGLGYWIEGGRRGYLTWGILHFQRV